jgi:hypothetical protein
MSAQNWKVKLVKDYRTWSSWGVQVDPSKKEEMDRISKDTEGKSVQMS